VCVQLETPLLRRYPTQHLLIGNKPEEAALPLLNGGSVQSWIVENALWACLSCAERVANRPLVDFFPRPLLVLRKGQA